MEEKLSEKITVLFSRTQNRKLNEICRMEDRPVSSMVRRIVENYIKVMENR